MTLPTYLPIRAWSNQDFAYTFTFRDSNGNLENVSTWLSELQIYDDVGGTLILDVGESGSFVNNGASGTIIGQVPDAIMIGLRAGCYTYDYRAFNAGAVAAWYHGEFVLEGGVGMNEGVVPIISPATDSSVVAESATGLTRAFTISNPWSQPAEMVLSVAFGGTVTAASLSLTRVVVPANSHQVVTVTYSASASPGAGTITATLWALGGTVQWALTVNVQADFSTVAAALTVPCVGYWDIRSLSTGAQTSWPSGSGAGAPAPALTGSGTVSGSGLAALLTVANGGTGDFASPSEAAYNAANGPITIMGVDYGDDWNGTDTFGFYAGLTSSGSSSFYMTRKANGSEWGKDGFAGFQGNNPFMSRKDLDGKLRMWFLSLNNTAEVLEFYPAPVDSQTLPSSPSSLSYAVSYGGFSGTSVSWRGRAGAVFQGLLASADKKALLAWASLYHAIQNDPGGKYISFDGDSRTLGFPSSTSHSTAGYVVQAMATLPYGYCNMGVGGETTALMVSGYSAGAHVALTQTSAAIKLGVVWGGVNDPSGGGTAATIYANLKTYWAAVRADGGLAVAVTEISSSVANWDGAGNIKNTLNALIKSDPTQYDALFDFGSTTLGADGANANRTLFQNDGVHPTLAGYTILAAVATAAISAAL